MERKSKNYYSVLAWINAVLDSCETCRQLTVCSRLMHQFYNNYTLNGKAGKYRDSLRAFDYAQLRISYLKKQIELTTYEEICCPLTEFNSNGRI